MYKNIVFSLLCIFSSQAYSQLKSIEEVLQQVEQNNHELKAMSSFLESRRQVLRSTNNLPDPEIGAYYLKPGSGNNAGNYTEFQVTQSFEFPTVYGARSKLIEKEQSQAALKFASKRKEILLEAKKRCLELSHINKQILVEKTRVEQAKKVFDQVKELFDSEQVGILDLNKARIAWMQKQFIVKELDIEKSNLLSRLSSLNGDNPMEADQLIVKEDLDLTPIESLWQSRLQTDPVLKSLKEEEGIALQQLKLSKNRSLPNLTLGFNSQGVKGERFSGVYAGLSIPIWKNRHKVKAAVLNHKYKQAYAAVSQSQTYMRFKNSYNEYQLLLSKYREYEATVKNLNNEQLLLTAYQLDEISFIEYYMELQFYRQAYDDMIRMEKQLHILQAELLDHQL